MPVPLMSCEFSAARLARPATALVGPGRRPSLAPAPAAPKKPAASVSARRRDDAEFSCGGSGGGGLVDEGMVVLRRRIHEMEAAERGWEPPQDWAAWEKEWYATYDADVCGLVGALQAFLMGLRPGVGVGLVAAILLALPASAFVLASHLLDASRAIVSNLQH
ncbi:hypothetical protein BS78_03G083400 [Paspalum vaginatum]|nr:hypothetical protein BS78_03G083400 [Paspalum vaginatum]